MVAHWLFELDRFVGFVGLKNLAMVLVLVTMIDLVSVLSVLVLVLVFEKGLISLGLMALMEALALSA